MPIHRTWRIWWGRLHQRAYWFWYSPALSENLISPKTRCVLRSDLLQTTHIDQSLLVFNSSKCIHFCWYWVAFYRHCPSHRLAITHDSNLNTSPKPSSCFLSSLACVFKVRKTWWSPHGYFIRSILALFHQWRRSLLRKVLGNGYTIPMRMNQSISSKCVNFFIKHAYIPKAAVATK
jgi:hypothetical protein